MAPGLWGFICNDKLLLCDGSHRVSPADLKFLGSSDPLS